jgi:hypothetical protein
MVRRWADEFAALSDANRAGGLGGEDLERLATAVYMLGDEEPYLDGLERAHHAHLEAGAVERAVRCAFWLGLILSLRGETGRANGWLGRAQRELERRDCVERGYLRLLATLQGPDPGVGYAGAADAAEIGRRFGDDDLTWLAVHEQGHCLIKAGRGRRRRIAARRGDGRGRRRRAVAGRDRAHLLQRARRLPAAPRAPAGPGVDGCHDALVRAAAGSRHVHGPVPRAPRRDHAGARRLAGGARRGAKPAPVSPTRTR